MNRWVKKLSSGILILLASCTLLSSSVFAQAAPPYVSIVGGTFNYNADTNALSVTMGSIGTVAYADGGFAFDWSVDPLWGGTFTIQGLTNGDGPGENWQFGVPGNSPVFRLFDYYGNERLNALIFDFEVVQNGSLFEVNANFDRDNVGGFNISPNDPSSKFIDDVNSFSPEPWGNLYMKFNFTDNGPNDFTQTQSGTVSGTFTVVPEPVSSVLFVTGGTTLAFIRYRRKKSRQVS